jgi:hypothetical protein
MDVPLLYRIKLLEFTTPRPNYGNIDTPLILFWNYMRRLKGEGNSFYA